MSITIPIRRVAIEKNKERMTSILPFFNSKKWKKLKKNGLYRRRNTSIYWQVEEENEDINIDIWGIGSFGSIHSSIWGKRPRQIQKLWDNMTGEFLSFLRDQNISYKLSVRYIKTTPFHERMILMLLLTFVLSFFIVVYTNY